MQVDSVSENTKVRALEVLMETVILLTLYTKIIIFWDELTHLTVCTTEQNGISEQNKKTALACIRDVSNSVTHC